MRSKRLAVAAVLVLLSACAGDLAEDTRPRGPLPRSENKDGQFSVRLLYLGDTDHKISSMTATGPGPDPGFTDTTVELTSSSYAPGAWEAVLHFGASHPDPLTVYDFAVTEGGATRHETGIVPCYLEVLPTPLAPLGPTTTSPVVFHWDTTAFESGFAYTVYVFDGGSGVKGTVVDQDTLSLALPQRQYDVEGAGYAVEAIRVGGYEPASPDRCLARATGPAFTVLP